MPQPTLHTARLELRPLAPVHLEYLVELDSDPEVLRYLYGRARSREEVEAHMPKRLAKAANSPGLGYWAGFVGDEFVGWWLLQRPESPEAGDPLDAEVGYRLLRRWWRQGLASEGARELMRYAFADLGVPRVTAVTMAVNEGSRAVMASIGMTYWQAFHQDFDEPVEGIEHGEVVYAITRQEWDQAGGV